MARDLVLDVVARKNSKDLEALALEFDKLAAAVDGSNKSSQQSVKFSKFLDDQIAETKKQVQSLAQTFEKTGSADAFGQLRGANRNLSVLERLRKQTVDLAGAEGEAKQELSGLDAEVQKLSTSYFELTRDHLAPARAEFDKLNDRLKTQSETVKILEQRYRESGDVLDQLDLRNARLDLERLDEETKGLADSLVNLKRSVPQHKDLSFGDFIKTETQKARVEVDRLRADLSKGGGFNVFGDLHKAQADLDVLEKVGKQATADFAKAGEGAGSGLMQGVAYGIGAAAPIVLPAAGGLILGGLGLGVIAAGIVGQLHSPEVVAGLAQLKSDAGGVFKDVTSPFSGVLRQELSDVDALVLKVRPELAGMFSAAAPAATALFEGVNGFVEKSLPGLRKGLDGAVIVVDELGRDLPAIGKAIGDAFAGAAQGAQGDAHALHDLLTVTDQLIVGSGRLAGTSGNLYEQMRSIATLNFDSPNLSMHSLQDTFDAVSTGGVTVLLKNIFGIGDKSKDAKPPTDALGDALGKNGLAGKANDAATAFDALDKAMLVWKTDASDAKGSALSFKDAVSTLVGDLKDGKGAFDDNSDAGRRSEEAYIAAAAAARKHADDVLKSTGNAQLAAQAYRDDMTALNNAATSAGVTAAKIHALNLELDDAIKIRKGLVEIEVNLTGNGKALITNQNTTILQGTGIKFFAAGGQYQAGQPRIVGENGPELDIPDHSGSILPSAALKGLSAPRSPLRATSASSGGGGYMLQAAPGGDSLTAQFLHALVDHGILQLVRAR